MDRKQYWNENYYKYWKERVAESESAGPSEIISDDTKTEPDDVYRGVFQTVQFAPGRLLDVGCAWGRMFPLYLEQGLEVSGADISAAMIEGAQSNWAGHEGIGQIVEADAEELPFPDAHFDNVACIAVFDATRQNESLTEFFRVLKPGGRLYLTGKNTRYQTDDEMALAAEAGARSKGHPNFFTDYPDMVRQIEMAGHRMVKKWFFLRRGDFFDFVQVTEEPDFFYDWFIIIERRDGPAEQTFLPFSDEVSQTFRAVDR